MEEKPRLQHNIVGMAFFVISPVVIVFAAFTERFYLLGAPFILYGVYGLIGGSLWVPGDDSLDWRARFVTGKEARMFSAFCLLGGVALSVISSLIYSFTLKG
jgi:hypothetical protein